MKYYKYLKRVVPFLFILLFTACVSRPVYFNKVVLDKKNIHIAVLPFKDFEKLAGNNSGDLVRSIFEANLINRGFKTIDVEKVLSELKISKLQEEDINIQCIFEIGKAVNADYVIFGSVYDYRVFQYLTTFMYIFEWLETTYSFGATAKMVSCKTGDVVWSGSYTSKSYTFNDAAEEVVNALFKTMKYKPIKK